MVEWWIFLYGVPAAIGALVFLKVVSNQVKAIDSAVHARAEALEIAAAKAMVEGAADAR